MNEPIQICFKCDGLIHPNVFHDCIRGLTDNINRLHNNLNLLLMKNVWINVSEKLPKNGQCVLVIANNSHSESDMNVMSVIYNENGASWSNNDKWEVDHFCEASYMSDIEWWMPLPKPPEVNHE